MVTGAGILTLTSCSTPTPNRNPTGDPFPPVSGESLKGEAIELPAAVAGDPAIFMVGYVQATQFDLDRWTLGFAQAKAKIRVVEVPAVVGWFPNVFLQSTIDNGMRAGIPSEDWGSVVTLYGADANDSRNSPEMRTLETAVFSFSMTEARFAGSGIRAIPPPGSSNCWNSHPR